LSITLFFPRSGAHRALHSFPTRRSSDLIDAVPDVTNNQVQVLTKAPALSPLEVEQFVTFPMELALKSIPDLVELRSVSKAGISVDRKSTRLNSSHVKISYAVFCLKKKKT